MGIVQHMTGALIAGGGALVLGVPGFVLGLILAFIYYGRAAKG